MASGYYNEFGEWVGEARSVEELMAQMAEQDAAERASKLDAIKSKLTSFFKGSGKESTKSASSEATGEQTASKTEILGKIMDFIGAHFTTAELNKTDEMLDEAKANTDKQVEEAKELASTGSSLVPNTETLDAMDIDAGTRLNKGDSVKRMSYTAEQIRQMSDQDIQTAYAYGYIKDDNEAWQAFCATHADATPQVTFKKGLEPLEETIVTDEKTGIYTVESQPFSEYQRTAENQQLVNSVMNESKISTPAPAAQAVVENEPGLDRAALLATLGGDEAMEQARNVASEFVAGL